MEIDVNTEQTSLTSGDEVIDTTTDERTEPLEPIDNPSSKSNDNDSVDSAPPLENMVDNDDTVCTLATCKTTENSKMFYCKQCERSTHYECTGLPAYQITLFRKKNYRNYICTRCAGKIDGDLEYLDEKIENINQVDTSFEECERLRSENILLKNKIKTLKGQQDRLRCDLSRKEELLNKVYTEHKRQHIT